MITNEQDLLALEGAMDFVNGDTDWYDLPESTRDTLYEFYCQNGMPYGVMKARTGDPDQWIVERMSRLFVAEF